MRTQIFSPLSYVSYRLQVEPTLDVGIIKKDYAEYFSKAIIDYIKELDSISRLYYKPPNPDIKPFLPALEKYYNSAHFISILDLNILSVFTILPGICTPQEGFWETPELLKGSCTSQFLISRPVHLRHLITQTIVFIKQNCLSQEFSALGYSCKPQPSIDVLKELALAKKNYRIGPCFLYSSCFDNFGKRIL